MSTFRKQTFFKITVVLIVLLILGQVVGSLTIRYLFIQNQIQGLFPQLLELSEDLAQTGNIHVKTGDFIVRAYDLNRMEMIQEPSPNADLKQLDERIQENLAPFILTVLSGEQVIEVRQLKALPQRSIILGTPIYQNDQVVGAAFLLKPATDYNVALTSFYLVFFCVTLLSGCIVVFMLRLYLLHHEKLEQTRRDYIANVSHELRSPISSVKALSETLCDDLIPDEPTKQRYYHIIRTESFRLERLINDMLELSRLQSGKNAFQMSDFDGNQLMQEIQAKYALFAEEMGLFFIQTENIYSLPLLHSNYDRMLQVIHILLDNAFKFCGEEGTITVDATIHPEYVKIFIRNTGEIIKKEDIPFVFERFYKSNQSRNFSGSGLGLSIAKEILNALGEQIHVSSSHGEGTTFSFTIQRA